VKTELRSSLVACLVLISLCSARESENTGEQLEGVDRYSSITLARARTHTHICISPRSPEYIIYTGLFEMIVGVLTTCHLVLQMQPHVISFYGVTSRIRFVFLLSPQVSRNRRYESKQPLKPSPLTCYKQFGTNSIIVLMFVESQRVHI